MIPYPMMLTLACSRKNEQVIINSVGGSGYEENRANAAYNYFDGLLRICFGFTEVMDVEIIRCENMSGEPELRETSYQEALSTIISLAKS